MLHSELCDRSLLNSSTSKRMDQPFGSTEVQKVMNVFQNSFSSTPPTPDVAKTVDASVKISCSTSLPKTSVSTSSEFGLAQCRSEPSDHFRKDIYNMSSCTTGIKARKRKLSVSSALPSNSNMSITTVPTSLVRATSLPLCSSASLSSLLAVNTPQVRNRVDVVLKSPTKEFINASRITNGVSSHTTSQFTTLTSVSSSSAKTVTFSLGNQQNLNLVRLTPVSLRSSIEPKVTSTAIMESEVKNLRALVLLHLDLVQQQQNIIAEKDKLIAELRAESNTVS